MMTEHPRPHSSKFNEYTNSHLWSFGLTFLVLMAAGLSVAWLSRTSLPKEGNPEVIFARDMVAHHEQAVEMALLIRDRSADAILRQLALDILLTQQAQMGQIQGWLAVWDVPLSGRELPMQGHAGMMGMAAQADINALQTLPITEAEDLFLQLMIRHHQGGVTMAETILTQTDRLEVQQLAKAIVEAQKSEIEYMRGLLK